MQAWKKPALDQDDTFFFPDHITCISLTFSLQLNHLPDIHLSKGFTCEVYHSCNGPVTWWELTCLTLATCRGFWCSTPPWSRKPHGAPPDNVIITSSATILLCPSFFLLSPNYFFNLWFWCVFIQLGPQSIDPMADNQGPPSQSSAVLLACHTVQLLTSLWVHLQGRRSGTHMHTRVRPPLSTITWKFREREEDRGV